jgi:CIC family chloride channel protein
MPPAAEKPGSVSRMKDKLARLNVAQATRWSFYFVAIGLIAGLGSNSWIPV